MIIIEPEEVAFFSKQTCFNCNEAINYNIYELFSQASQGELIFQGVLPESVMDKIYEGIRKSTNISNTIKKQIGLL